MKTTLVVESQVNGTFMVSASLFDACNTPAGYVEGNVPLMNGTNTFTIDVNVSGYAYVGIGSLHIVVSRLEHIPLTSFDLQVYIDVLGDFNGDNIINSQDIAHFSEGYMSFWCNNTIAPCYENCDIIKNQRIDSQDIAAFAMAYICYLKYQR